MKNKSKKKYQMNTLPFIWRLHQVDITPKTYLVHHGMLDRTEASACTESKQYGRSDTALLAVVRSRSILDTRTAKPSQSGLTPKALKYNIKSTF